MFCFFNDRVIDSRILKPEHSSGIYAIPFSSQMKKKVNHLEVLLETGPAFSYCLGTIM